MSWTNDNILEFIDLYRRERVLWDPKHPQSRNRGEVSLAWMRIQSCLNIHCSIVDLKKKKESLMTSFRFHWNRKRKNSNYRTTWFAYAPMENFLCGKYECDSTNVLDNEFLHNTESYRHSQADTDPIAYRNSSTPEKSNRQLRIKTFPIKNSCRSQSNDLTKFSKGLNEDKNLDEYDLYGQLLAKKLRKLDEHQRDVAMHDIDNIMFRAKMQSGSSQTRSYSSSTSPVPRKTKSPIFIVTQHQTQYDSENISYPDQMESQ